MGRTQEQECRRFQVKQCTFSVILWLDLTKLVGFELRPGSWDSRDRPCLPDWRRLFCRQHKSFSSLMCKINYEILMELNIPPLRCTPLHTSWSTYTLIYIYAHICVYLTNVCIYTGIDFTYSKTSITNAFLYPPFKMYLLGWSLQTLDIFTFHS